MGKVLMLSFKVKFNPIREKVKVLLYIAA